MQNNSYLIYAYNSLVKEDEEILSVVIPTKNNQNFAIIKSQNLDMATENIQKAFFWTPLSPFFNNTNRQPPFLTKSKIATAENKHIMSIGWPLSSKPFWSDTNVEETFLKGQNL